MFSQQLEIGLRNKGKAQDTNLEGAESKEKRIRSFLAAMSFCGVKFKNEDQEEAEVGSWKGQGILMYFPRWVSLQFQSFTP